MVMSATNNSRAVVIDANVLIAICAKEKDKHTEAEAALKDYAASGWVFYAPNVIVAEVLYVLCNKLQNGVLSATAYEDAIQDFQDQMTVIFLSPQGETSLITRAKEIQNSYGCSRQSDSIYIALAEELLNLGATELLTFDRDIINQVAKNAPSVKVNLLPA